MLELTNHQISLDEMVLPITKKSTKGQWKKIARMQKCEVQEQEMIAKGGAEEDGKKRERRLSKAEAPCLLSMQSAKK